MTCSRTYSEVFLLFFLFTEAISDQTLYQVLEITAGDMTNRILNSFNCGKGWTICKDIVIVCNECYQGNEEGSGQIVAGERDHLDKVVQARSFERMTLREKGSLGYERAGQALPAGLWCFPLIPCNTSIRQRCFFMREGGQSKFILESQLNPGKIRALKTKKPDQTYPYPA